MDLNQIGARIRAKPKVHRPVTRRSVTDAAGHVVILGAALAHHLDARAHAVAIALSAFVARCRANVRRFGLRFIHISASALSAVATRVDASVAIQIAKRAAAMARRRNCSQSGRLRERNDPFPVLARFRPGLRKTVLNSSISAPGRGIDSTWTAGHEDVFPAIVVKIDESRAVAGHAQRRLPHAAGRGHLAKVSLCRYFRAAERSGCSAPHRQYQDSRHCCNR